MQKRAYTGLMPQNAPLNGELPTRLGRTYLGGMKFSVLHALTSFHYQNAKLMSNLLYLVAVILIIAWLVGFVGFHAGGIIHILLVIAVISILVRVIQGRRVL